jgi:DNA-binding NtrC family response regulator
VTDGEESLVGIGTAMRAIDAEIEYAARSDAKVLITGESGVGKEVIARLVHQRSRRAHTPLVTVNCAGIPDSLLESALFGHVKGSFTGAYRDRLGLLEMAHQGTIFLDEIGEMSLRMQALLLRFLENGEIQRVGADRVQSRVNVRVIAATNRNLLERIGSKDFREDLYYRLNVIHITIPPLRARREDIPAFLDYFLRSYAERHGVPPPELEPEAIAHLVAYDWPGNVRELKNVAERLIVRSRSGILTIADLPAELQQWGRPAAVRAPAAVPTSVADDLYDRLVMHRESFWTVVYPAFMARDLTRADLRTVLRRGLQQTGGNYKVLVQLFNMPPTDYKRFLNFLRKHECHVPFARASRGRRVIPTRHLRSFQPRPSRSQFQKHQSFQQNTGLAASLEKISVLERACATVNRREPGDSDRQGGDRLRHAVRRQGPHHRRQRRRQGSDRAPRPPGQPAGAHAARGAELRGDPRRTARVGALRPREGQLHGRAP